MRGSSLLCPTPMNTVRAQGIRPFAAPAAHADGEAGLEQEDAATCHDAPGEGKAVGFGGQSSRRISITPRVSEGMKERLAFWVRAGPRIGNRGSKTPKGVQRCTHATGRKRHRRSHHREHGGPLK